MLTCYVVLRSDFGSGLEANSFLASHSRKTKHFRKRQMQFSQSFNYVLFCVCIEGDGKISPSSRLTRTTSLAVYPLVCSVNKDA